MMLPFIKCNVSFIKYRESLKPWTNKVSLQSIQGLVLMGLKNFDSNSRGGWHEGTLARLPHGLDPINLIGLYGPSTFLGFWTN